MRTLCVGIGCRLHTAADQIETAVRTTLGSHAFEDIAIVASIETKARERGLLEFCARHGLPLELFSREQIDAMRVTKPSAAVREHLGVDSVCEACALLAASAAASLAASLAPSLASSFAASLAPSLAAPPRAPLCAPLEARANASPQEPPRTAPAPNPRLIVAKTVHGGVTVAIASATRVQADGDTIIQQDLS
jgi:cobalamin biosynthesis protein CbiG